MWEYNNIYVSNEVVDNNSLEHYGVKGQRWGFRKKVYHTLRRTKKKLATNVSKMHSRSQQKRINKKAEAAAKKIKLQKETENKLKQLNKEELRKKTTAELMGKKPEDMTNQELTEYITRKRLLNTYADLNKNDINRYQNENANVSNKPTAKKKSVGKKLVKSIGNDVVKPVAIDLGKQILKDIASDKYFDAYEKHYGKKPISYKSAKDSKKKDKD